MVQNRVNLLNAYLEDSPQYNVTPWSPFEKHLREGHIIKIRVIRKRTADNPPIEI